jgi:uracil phosphoribosyltransferase
MPAPLPSLTVFDHPLIQHKLGFIRDAATGHRAFRNLLAEVAGLMVFEATRSFPTHDVSVQTPLTTTTVRRLAGVITVVPVLRAGLGMAQGILDIIPEARVGHLGIVRDEHTLKPRAYLERLPSRLGDGPVILVDPMLATGGSAIAALDTLKKAGAKDLRMMVLVASPLGVKRVHDTHADVAIYTAAIDPLLNDKGYIVPGLGDAGDRMYGTV